MYRLPKDDATHLAKYKSSASAAETIKTHSYTHTHTHLILPYLLALSLFLGLGDDQSVSDDFVLPLSALGPPHATHEHQMV